ncbi:RRQRL motif-containing zinc-binding protein [Nocardia fluminea]|uniref:RRQRL motif-containing zinc-binding protein n=1 Tax=Nocardia fluminea TaxID=134984 RepID=UPI0037122974
MSAQHDQLDQYDWMTAPSHFMTRRQLRAAGLRPNGQDVAALMVRVRRGRRLVAHLYDSRRAAPKRTASPAQLIAIAKAVRGHQLAAALRRGITEQQLTTAGDPGAAWTTTVVTEKGNPMSDNQTTTKETEESVAREHAEYLREQLIQAEKDARTPGLFVGQVEGAPHRAVGPAEGVGWVVDYARRELHTHLAASRHLLGEHPDWKPRYDEIDDAAVISTKVAPVGHGQRVAHLRAVVAVNQSRYRRERRAREYDIAVGEGQASVDELNALMAEQAEAAKERLSQPVRWANPDGVALRLTDALTWRGELDVADDQVVRLVGSFAHDWGVIVDPDKATVRINPDHDAAERQRFDEAAVLWDRESAVIDIVSASGLDPEIKGQVMEAIHRWRGSEVDYYDPQQHIDNQAARREQLGAELAELPLPAEDRAYLDLTVDYLRGDVTGVDLLNTPVSVDPGEEARGRMAELLTLYAGGSIAPQEMATEIAVMTPQDQELLREIGRNIRDGNKPDLRVWPDYIDRDEFTESLLNYLNDAEEQRAEADYIIDNFHPDPSELGINDDIESRLHRMAAAHDALHDTVKTSRGLVSTERHQLTSVLAEIETGRVLTRDQLPELLFLDERTKSEVDDLRESAVINAVLPDLPQEVSERVTAATSIDADNPVRQVISTASEKLHDTVRSVARGGSGRTVEQSRELFLAQRNALGKALGRAGVDRDTMGEIRTMIDASAKTAAQTRTELNNRRAQWPTRVDKFIADRDHAAPAGPAPAGRACRTRSDRAATQAAASEPVPAPARYSSTTAGQEMQR